MHQSFPCPQCNLHPVAQGCPDLLPANCATVDSVDQDTLVAIARLAPPSLDDCEVVELPVILRALSGLLSALVTDGTVRWLLPDHLTGIPSAVYLAGKVTWGGNCNVLLREAIALLSQQQMEP